MNKELFKLKVDTKIRNNVIKQNIYILVIKKMKNRRQYDVERKLIKDGHMVVT